MTTWRRRARLLRPPRQRRPAATRRLCLVAHKDDPALKEPPPVPALDQAVVVAADPRDGVVLGDENEVGPGVRLAAFGVDDGVDADVLAPCLGWLGLDDPLLDGLSALAGLADGTEGGVLGIQVGPFVESPVIAEVGVLGDRPADLVFVAHAVFSISSRPFRGEERGQRPISSQKRCRPSEASRDRLQGETIKRSTPTSSHRRRSSGLLTGPLSVTSNGSEARPAWLLSSRRRLIAW